MYGHTRYQILRKYPFIPFEVIEKEFSSRYEALAWICKNQLGRRNLTPEQKKFLIGKQAEAEKQIKSFHGNQYTLASESGLVQNEPDRTKHGSRSKVAAEHGTSESYVYRAEQFAKGVEAAEEAVPGAQKEILSGKIRATDREISSIAKVPKEKRPDVVAELRKPKAKRDSSIDDFGMERGTEYALEQIYSIVDSRYRSQKPLIVTTNLTLDEIRHPQDTAHARIYDRLLEMCVPISCIGVSLRKENAQEKLERMKLLVG